MFGLSFFICQPIYGSCQSPHAGDKQEHASPKNQFVLPAAAPTITVVNQYRPSPDANAAPKHTESYLHRLFSPENIPNILLFFVGTAGVVVAVCTFRKIERQTRATEESLVLTQRPRIIVRNFYFTKSAAKGAPYHVLSAVESGSVASGQFSIVNTGATTATVRDIVCQTFISNDGTLPMRPPYEGATVNKAALQMKAGEISPYTFGREEPFTQFEANPFFTLDSPAKFFVLGWIGYTDDVGTYRFTHFCRYYAPIHGKRFASVIDPDYENAD